MNNSKEHVVSSFEDRVTEGLENCGIVPADFFQENISFGAAVSGGADSVALLVSLAHIAKDNGIKVHAITVNHHIRPEVETTGDSSYVETLCRSLAEKGFPVDCTTVDLPKGKVAAFAHIRGKGPEDAARFLRYEAFSDFVGNTDIGCLCLAHNRNDQLETLLMRFFQGSAGGAASGIKKRRGIFVRPLLAIPRNDIEDYLTTQKIDWRIDKTNYDNRYLRNRMRNLLMPFLDSLVPGWRTAVLTGARKAFYDEEALSGISNSIPWEKKPGGVWMKFSVFAGESPAIRRRLLYTAFDKIGCSVRIPYYVVEQVCLWPESEKKIMPLSLQISGICITVDSAIISVEKNITDATERGFFVIIEKFGEYNLQCGRFKVQPVRDDIRIYISDGQNEGIMVQGLRFPFCIRSLEPGDEVLTSGGGMKSVSKIFSDWHVSERDRFMISIIQELETPEQNIVFICGSICGYSNWVVKQFGMEQL